MVYCFNCKKQNHGFKICKSSLKLCTNCKTKGHSSEQCEFFNSLCYRCTEIGKLVVKCKKHNKLKRCGAIILDNKKRILLVKSHSDVWSIPKGHQIHHNESYSKCAMREVYEETGLKLKITNNFKHIEIGNIIYFLIVLNDYYKKYLNIKDNEEIKHIEWVDIKDILKLNNVNWSLRQIGKYFLSKNF